MAEVLGIPGPGESVTTTSKQLTPSTHSDHSEKVMSKDAVEAFRRQREAEDEYLRSMQGLPPVSTPSALDAEAEAKSKEGSRVAIERAEANAQPDPFQPVAPPPTMMGKPLMAPIQAKPTPGPRPYTSQEFNASTEGGPGGVDVLTGNVQENANKLPAMAGGIKGPQTIAEAKDESNAYAAYEKEKIAAERLRAEKEMAAEKAKREQAAYARVNELAAQVEKDRNALFEKPSTFSTILGAIAQALGAYGAGLTRGPNWAAEIIKNGQEQDLQAKKMRLEASLEKMKAAGAAPQHIEAWAKAQQERLVATEKAQIDAVEKRTMAMLAPFPQARAAVAEQMAKLKAEQAQKTAEFVQKSTEKTVSGGSSREGTKQSETTGSKEGTTEGRAKGAQQAAVAKVQGEHAKRLEKLIDESEKNFPSPEQIRKIQDNTNATIRQNRVEEHSALQAFFGQSLRKLREKGIVDISSVPSSIFDNTGMTAKQKEAWTLHVLSAHTQSINEAGTGFLSNDISRDAIFSPRVAQPNDPHELNLEKVRNGIEFAKTTAQMVEDASREGHRAKVVEDRREAAGEGKKPEATTAKPKSAKDISARLTSEDRQAKAWAEAHPADPRAREITKRLRAKLIGGK